MGLAVATQAFFKLLFNRELSESFGQLVAGDLQPKLEQGPAKPEPKHKAVRSEAISLLAALQREARLLDLSLIHI